MSRPTDPATDLTRSEPAPFVCSCGTTYVAKRWRIVDVRARPQVADRLHASGCFEGRCPKCGLAAEGRSPWVEADSQTRKATLVLSEHARGELLAALQSHLNFVAKEPALGRPWILTPHPAFEEASVVQLIEDQASPEDESSPPVPPAGVPEVVGSVLRPPSRRTATSLGAATGILTLEEGRVVVRTGELEDAWRTAALKARPILVRNRKYPLLGVRVVGSYMGKTGCLDGVVDVGRTEASELFRRLSEQFEVHVAVAPGAVRKIEGQGLERNAVLCLEAARAQLTGGDHPPSAFSEAVEEFAAVTVEERLAPSAEAVHSGDYQHLVGASETLAALEHLDRVSRSSNLARLLEVDGLPVGEYEAIRKRILRASVEHGLCAPRRFWRRIVSSGLAEDAEDYAAQLAQKRAAAAGTEGDLEGEVARNAWLAIADLCERKDIPAPLEVREALDLPDPVVLLDESSRPIQAAGEINSDDKPQAG